jgi:hypothetical protein
MSIMTLNTECCYTECCKQACYAECRYAECRGVLYLWVNSRPYLKILDQSVKTYRGQTL